MKAASYPASFATTWRCGGFLIIVYSCLLLVYCAVMMNRPVFCADVFVATTPLQHTSKQPVKTATGSTRGASPLLLNSHADVQGMTGKEFVHCVAFSTIL